MAILSRIVLLIGLHVPFLTSKTKYMGVGDMTIVEKSPRKWPNSHIEKKIEFFE